MSRGREVSRAAPAWRWGRLPCLAAALLLSLAARALAGAEDYTVAEGDVLEIAVFDHPDLATVAPVSRDGQIRFPLIGQVYVGGLTAARVADVLTARLAAGYLVDPQVSVSVRQMRTKRASVVGRVNRPGIYEFQGQMSLLELLSRAGGLAPGAGGQAVVRRRSPPAGVAGDLVVDVRALLAEGAVYRDVEIRDGDAVTVAEAGVFTVAGEVQRPGEYRHEEGMTLLRAVALAGGFTEQADPERITIVGRAGGAAPAGAGAPLERRLEAGDVVTVPAAGRYYLTGEVRRPGEYRHEEGMTLLRAVTLAGGYTERADAERVRIIRAGGEGAAAVDAAVPGAAPATVLRAGDIVVVNVARAEVCYVTGEVKSAGAYRCDRDTTVIKAVTLAGGFTDAAARGRIRIIRRAGGEERVLERVGLEEPVRPDDVLVVPKSFF